MGGEADTISPPNQQQRAPAPPTLEDAKHQYRILVDLWISENSTKTNKLQVLGLANSVFFTGFILTDQYGGKMAAALIGIAFSLFWLFSIGNTVSHQKRWASKISELEQSFPNHFRVFSQTGPVDSPIYGRMPAPYILLGSPLFAIIAWLMAMLLLHF